MGKTPYTRRLWVNLDLRVPDEARAWEIYQAMTATMPERARSDMLRAMVVSGLLTLAGGTTAAAPAEPPKRRGRPPRAASAPLPLPETAVRPASLPPAVSPAPAPTPAARPAPADRETPRETSGRPAEDDPPATVRPDREIEPARPRGRPMTDDGLGNMMW